MITIALDGETEDRVRVEAYRRGVDPARLAIDLLERGLSDGSVPAVGDRGVALILRRRAEEATNDPAELERRRVDTEELMRSLDRHPADAP